MKIEYGCTIEPQEPAGYFVQFVDLEEAFTEGATLEEALYNAAEVLTGIINYRMDNKSEIPLPSSPKEGQYPVSPAISTQTALLIHFTREGAGKTLADMARSLETSWPAAARLEDPRHWPSLRQLDKAAAILGKRLVLSME